MKKIILIYSLFLLSNNTFSFDAKNVYEKIAPYLNLQKGSTPESERIREMDEIIKSINDEMEKTPSSSELLLLKGLANCAYLYVRNQQPVSVVANLKSECQKYLSLSIDSHKQGQALSYHQLATIKSYSGPELSVKVIEQILASDHYFDDRDRVELRRNKISHLIRLGRYNDAINELQLLNEKFPSFARKEWDDAFKGKIEEAKANKENAVKSEKKIATADQLTIKSPQKKPSKTAASKQPIAIPIPKHQASSPIAPEVTRSDQLFWYSLLGAVLLLLVGVILYIKYYKTGTAKKLKNEKPNSANNSVH